MRTRSAAELAALIEAGGEPCTVTADPDTVVGPAVVIDSRQATSGALFVALPGENVDGHDYVAAAAALGATAAIVTHQVDAPLAELVCEDAQQGLTALARSLHAEARAAGLQTVAITGSAGKYMSIESGVKADKRASTASSNGVRVGRVVVVILRRSCARWL